MSSNPGAPPCWLHWCAAGLLLLLIGCSQLPPTSSVVIPPVPAGAARIWIYRDGGVYDDLDRPYLNRPPRMATIDFCVGLGCSRGLCTAGWLLRILRLL